jgi:hypothetical protein
MIQMLVQAGVDPNIRAGTFTPLHRAAECNTETVMRALLDAGADPTAANEAGATSPWKSRENRRGFSLDTAAYTCNGPNGSPMTSAIKHYPRWLRGIGG